MHISSPSFPTTPSATKTQSTQQPNAPQEQFKVPDDDTSVAAKQTDAPVSKTDAKRASAVKDFLAYMEMTPNERMQYIWLKQRDITMEEFERLPPEEKQKLLEEMRQDFEEEIERKAKSQQSRTDILV